MLTASQLSRSGRAIRRYFFFFFGFFFSFRMFWPFATGSPPLVGLFDYRCPGGPQTRRKTRRRAAQAAACATVGPSPRSVVRRMSRGSCREGPGAVHGLTVVPHHQIADPPLVGIDE